jgi:hypothetical protein
MVRVTENGLEPPAKGRGLFSYLFDGVEFSFPFSFSLDLIANESILAGSNKTTDLNIKKSIQKTKLFLY